MLDDDGGSSGGYGGCIIWILKMAEKIGMKHVKTEERGYITYICLIFMFFTLL